LSIFVSGISVIIPAYNREHLIGETLESLLNQTLSADEIIVVDDGSTDGTSIAAQAAFEEWKGGNVKGQKVPEFMVIKQENNGPGAARNAGFAAAHGEFIHFFDSDDIALPNKQEVQQRALQESGADIAYGPWVKGSFEGKSFRPENHVLQQKGLPQGDLVKALLTSWSIVPHACLFRRSIVEKSGGFPEHLFVGEDQLMFLNCLLVGAKVVHSPGTLELYRVENECKITAPRAGAARHALHWAQFLLDADESCRRCGMEPSQWFGFRKRAWEACEDLRQHGIGESALEAGLRKIFENKPLFFYKEHRRLERWKGGLLQRLTGGRASNSLRAGPLAPEQQVQLNALGYQLADEPNQ
jgi:glycosyltransferase involved in cell wall biosynthesis